MTKEYVVAKTSDIAPGTAKQVEVDGEPIAIFNVNGEFFAISDTCSHAQASLSEGAVEDFVVTCPWHGARFDIKTGKNLCMPAVTPVQKFDLKIEGDAITIVM
ncbi:MAG: non-heme iron oxygenase ferredoxin subunit [Deltaproteobacteria bacterium]|nr:non-heme iron oxygenase ferredoxin subunit [Deltaproteobacteria bacterium]